MARLDPTVEDQLRLAETRERERDVARVAGRELGAELFATLLVVASAVGLWLVRPPGAVRWEAVILCTAILVVAMRVRFETSYGFTVATQLAFVPLAYVAPVALLAPAVMIAFALSLIPELARGRLAWSKLIYVPSNCAFVMGPAWVFAFAGAPRHAGPVILLSALAAQFLVDFLISGLQLRIVRGVSLRAQIADVRWVWTIDCAFTGIAFVDAERTVHHSAAVLAIAPLLFVFSVFARERSGRLQKLLEVNETYLGTAKLLGEIVEADDAYTGLHSQGVVELAQAVGGVLGLNPERLRNLEFAALLHDVGKIAIPKEIINKPGRLTAEEWELVKTHAVVGQRMLARVGGFMESVGAIVRSHHERWDGLGYPDGLRGEAAPVEARIITACDSWSAMRTDRPYRRAMSYEAAREEVQRNIGTQFDPVIAEALLSVARRAEPAEDALSVGAELPVIDSAPLPAERR